MNSFGKIAFVMFLIILVFAFSSPATDTSFQYPVKIKGHPGGDATPSEALKMVKENPNTYIVDVRTRPEYVLVGHPTMAYHVPIKFWTGKHASKGYGMADNADFAADLKKRFNPETDTLIFMCRSGGRSIMATRAAVYGKWPENKVYNMLGGFEGDKIKNKDSMYDKKRKMGGWKNEGLPWTYSLDAKRSYPEAE